METSAFDNDTLELGSDLNQETLSTYSVKYLLPLFLLPPITGNVPLQFNYTEDQDTSQAEHFTQSELGPSDELQEPLQVEFHEMSQSTYDIEMSNMSSVTEDYNLLENFAADLLDNAIPLPGELNKLIYENIDDLLI